MKNSNYKALTTRAQKRAVHKEIVKEAKRRVKTGEIVPSRGEPTNMRGAKLTNLQLKDIKQAKVITDGNNNFWAEIEFKVGRQVEAYGTRQVDPHHSFEDAYEHAIYLVADTMGPQIETKWDDMFEALESNGIDRNDLAGVRVAFHDRVFHQEILYDDGMQQNVQSILGSNPERHIEQAIDTVCAASVHDKTVQSLGQSGQMNETILLATALAILCEVEMYNITVDQNPYAERKVA
jgi:hypothetical protein